METLAEIGIGSASYATIERRLPKYTEAEFRDRLTAACAAHAGIGPGVLVLYDVTTLYFETDEGDDFRKPGFSEERRLEPQIAVGLLSDATSRVDLTPGQVIGSYRQLLEIEKAFRMSKSNLKARPIYHHKRESIDAHLTVVMAAMAVGRFLEQRSRLSLNAWSEPSSATALSN